MPGSTSDNTHQLLQPHPSNEPTRAYRLLAAAGVSVNKGMTWWHMELRRGMKNGGPVLPFGCMPQHVLGIKYVVARTLPHASSKQHFGGCRMAHD